MNWEKNPSAPARQQDTTNPSCQIAARVLLAPGNVHCRDVIMICAHELQRHRVRSGRWRHALGVGQAAAGLEKNGLPLFKIPRYYNTENNGQI